MRIPIFQVDAFTSTLFGGNPAAVCPLAEPIPDALQQSIALENQLSETAFLVPEGDGFHLRWFTPAAEVDLCGHATLAAGHVVLTELSPERADVQFRSMSGPLSVARHGERYRLELPSRPGETEAVTPELTAALGVEPLELRRTSRDLYARLENERQVRELTPDFRAIGRIDATGIGVAAPGETVDVVSRFFCPALDIDEDPVTGSAHSTWVPWFADRLGRTRLVAHQVSRRGGELHCELSGDRVLLDGQCVTYLRGEIEV